MKNFMRKYAVCCLFGLILSTPAGAAEYVIFDLDGTLADVSVRQARLEQMRRDNVPEQQAFAEFLDPAGIKTDTVAPQIKELINFYKEKGYGIFLLSGRHWQQQEETVKWLRENHISYDVLKLQEKGNVRKDIPFKEGVYKDIIKNGDSVHAAFDDQKPIADMWRRLGVYAFDVAGADYQKH